MTYADDFNIRTTSVKFNDVADALDGLLTRNYVSSTTGGPVNYIATPSPAWSSYTTASFLIIVPNVTNTAGSPSVTINVSGLGAKAIKRNNVDIAAGTLEQGIPTILVYTGTYFEALLVNALLRDGTNTMLANLNFGGFRPTNVAAGTAAAPAYCPGNDADTGMWLPTANNLAFSTGGTERFRIDVLGKAGFGNSDPQYPLVIGSGVGRSVVSIFGGLSGTADGAALYITGTTATNHAAAFGHYSAILGGAADATPTLYTGGNLRFNSSTTVVGVLNGTGLSIGTGVVAGFPLEVQANAGNAVGLSTKGRASDNIGVALFTNNAGTETARIQAAPTSLSISKEGNNPLALSTNGSERVRVTGTGLVGIGTTGPSEALHVYRASGEVNVLSESGSLANGQMASVHALAPGTSLTRSAKIMVYKHSGISSPCGALSLDQQDNTSSYIWPDDTTVLRISSTITHIGTTSGTVVGTQTSDARLKDISTDPFPYGLSDVLAIEPVAFTFTNDPDQVERIGFSAQQVRPIVSEAVYDTNEPIVGEPEGAPTKLAMDYTALIPVLVKAIQELEARIAILEA